MCQIAILHPQYLLRWFPPMRNHMVGFVPCIQKRKGSKMGPPDLPQKRSSAGILCGFPSPSYRYSNPSAHSDLLSYLQVLTQKRYGVIAQLKRREHQNFLSFWCLSTPWTIRIPLCSYMFTLQAKCLPSKFPRFSLHPQINQSMLCVYHTAKLLTRQARCKRG